MSAMTTRNQERKVTKQEQPVQAQPTYDWAASANGNAQSWHPAVDIYETGDAIVIKTELPGVKKGDLQVSVENNVLTIAGVRPAGGDNPRGFLHLERPYGVFRRSFTLPGNVDQAKIHSDFRHGILSVALPKRDETKPRQIEVTID